MIRVLAGSDDRFVEYALELISRFLGIDAGLVADGSCDVYYGNDSNLDCEQLSRRNFRITGFP